MSLFSTVSCKSWFLLLLKLRLQISWISVLSCFLFDPYVYTNIINKNIESCHARWLIRNKGDEYLPSNFVILLFVWLSFAFHSPALIFSSVTFKLFHFLKCISFIHFLLPWFFVFFGYYSNIFAFLLTFFYAYLLIFRLIKFII